MPSLVAHVIHRFAGVIGLDAVRAAVEGSLPVRGCIGRAETAGMDFGTRVKQGFGDGGRFRHFSLRAFFSIVGSALGPLSIVLAIRI